jgi:hypothetical protein
VHGDLFVVVDGFGPVVLDVRLLVVADGLGAVVPDRVRLVVLDLDVLVPLGMQPDLLGALLVLEAQRVGIAVGAALAGARQDAALRGIGG